ncbi:hypothetical protein IMG5_107470 [Ichthyophthirius multifiliis]|uniref:Transmembrane protein n=1 Tax=Ichthyophthirius multifiliis TaxID=5932 RepID=G0QTF0_ICHMU|nr:hypothetical protein IMG5_107470 [Ichthyophthirius multifiliis]EGR31527.1 hypothetical protein IMG5_107470 [Ichthyophthirius multifiliis]|eukprot:XP_004035013.1 hypothetical protein IMG5_107470 [Ichthyophthirius multifiliis]
MVLHIIFLFGNCSSYYSWFYLWNQLLLIFVQILSILIIQQNQNMLIYYIFQLNLIYYYKQFVYLYLFQIINIYFIIIKNQQIFIFILLCLLLLFLYKRYFIKNYLIISLQQKKKIYFNNLIYIILYQIKLYQQFEKNGIINYSGYSFTFSLYLQLVYKIFYQDKLFKQNYMDNGYIFEFRNLTFQRVLKNKCKFNIIVTKLRRSKNIQNKSHKQIIKNSQINIKFQVKILIKQQYYLQICPNQKKQLNKQKTLFKNQKRKIRKQTLQSKIPKSKLIKASKA